MTTEFTRISRNFADAINEVTKMVEPGSALDIVFRECNISTRFGEYETEFNYDSEHDEILISDLRKIFGKDHVIVEGKSFYIRI